MGILDDAIREHLDLKRKHGAREAELREIEDEALGSGDQPDPFSAGGELFGDVSAGGSGGPQGTTATEEPPAGLSEPPPGLAEPAPGLGEESPGGEEPTRLVEPEALRPDPDAPSGESDLLSREPEFERFEPSEPETSEPDEAPGPSESLEDLIAEEEPFPEDTAAPPSADTPLPEYTSLPGQTPPSDETPLPEPDDVSGPPPVSPEQESLDVPASEPDEPRERPLEPDDSVPDPPPPPPDTGPEPPGRARGRVDVPTQEHPPPGETGGLPPLPAEEPGLEAEPDLPPLEDEPFAEEEPSDAGAPALYDFETDEDPISTTDEPPAETGDDFEALGPAEEAAPYVEEEEPYAEEPASGTEPPPAEPFDEPSTEVRPSLEDEDDEEDLWFEKGPPKDFDFDD